MMRTVRIIVGAALLISIFVSIDLGLNYMYNLATETHDGLTTNSVIHSLFGIFGDGVWSLDVFFRAFEISIWISFVLLTLNIIFSIKNTTKKRSIFSS